MANCNILHHLKTVHIIFFFPDTKMIAEVLYFTGLGLIAYAIYKWVTLNNQYFTRRGIPHMKPYFLVGNTGGLFFKLHSAPDYVLYMYRQFPKEK